MSFPKYPAYKPSGIPWLGDVPEHWEMKRLKRACLIFPSNVDKKSYDGEKSVLLCNYTDVYYNENIISGMNFMSATATDEQIKKFTLRAGDTIITKDSETSDDIAIAAYVPNDIPGVICGYHLSMVRPQGETYGPFIKCFFDSKIAKAQFEVAANGLTRVGLSQYAIDNVHCPYPPKNEQSAIAAFLTRETSKIDALVAEQQKLIALLKEKRQAVISHAVTKGLDPSVPMKDSGVEWLGEVPAHWDVRPVKHIADIGNGATPNRDRTDYWTDGDYPWLSSTVVNQDIVREADEFVTQLALAECHLPKISPPAVLIGITGQGKTRGMAATLAFETTINQHIAFLKPKAEQVLIAFLRRYFDMAYEWMRFESDGGGSTKGAITCDQLANMRMPYPLSAEQKSICDFLDQETIKFDALVTEAQSAIALLQERRTALISAAVTGKMDVRHLA